MGVDRDDGEGSPVLQFGRLRLGVVAPVEREDDCGIVAILWSDVIIIVTKPSADLSLLNVVIDGTAAVAVVSSEGTCPESAILENSSRTFLKDDIHHSYEVHFDHCQPDTLWTFVSSAAFQRFDLSEVFVQVLWFYQSGALEHTLRPSRVIPFSVYFNNLNNDGE